MSSPTSILWNPIQLVRKDPEYTSLSEIHEKHRATLAWLGVKLIDRLLDQYIRVSGMAQHTWDTTSWF